MPGQGANAQLVPVAEDEVEFEEVVDVNQPFGPGQAEFHHGQQAVPSGYDTRLGAVAREKFKSIADRAGPHVVEGSRNLHSPYLTPWRQEAARRRFEVSLAPP